MRCATLGSGSGSSTPACGPTIRLARHSTRNGSARRMRSLTRCCTSRRQTATQSALPSLSYVTSACCGSRSRASPPTSARTRGHVAGTMPPRVAVSLASLATNHLAVQWFLNSCWASLRAKTPDLRLRLIGLPPGYKVGADGSERKCDPQEDVHCGWAWGTPYLGLEDRHGIDTLGFVSQACNRAQSGVIGRNRAQSGVIGRNRA
jgi:hypothetical protein